MTTKYSLSPLLIDSFHRYHYTQSTGCVWPLPGQAIDYDEEVDDKDRYLEYSSSGVNTTIKKEDGDDDEISSYYDSSDNEEYAAPPPKKRALSRSVFVTPPPKRSRIVKIEK